MKVVRPKTVARINATQMNPTKPICVLAVPANISFQIMGHEPRAGFHCKDCTNESFLTPFEDRPK